MGRLPTTAAPCADKHPQKQSVGGLPGTLHTPVTLRVQPALSGCTAGHPATPTTPLMHVTSASTPLVWKRHESVCWGKDARFAILETKLIIYPLGQRSPARASFLWGQEHVSTLTTSGMSQEAGPPGPQSHIPPTRPPARGPSLCQRWWQSRDGHSPWEGKQSQKAPPAGSTGQTWGWRELLRSPAAGACI